MIFAMSDSDPYFSYENNVIYANLRNSDSDKKQPCSVDNDTYQTWIVSDTALQSGNIRTHTRQTQCAIHVIVYLFFFVSIVIW